MTDTSQQIPSDIDFDNWDDKKEEAALKEIAAAAKCKYAIGDQHFYGRFPDGTVLSMPLDISLEDVNEISQDDVASADQVETFISQPTPSMIDMANKYFETFQKINQLVLEK